jgi:hypothetical protein
MIRTIGTGQIPNSSSDSVIKLSGNKLDCVPGKDLLVNSFVWIEAALISCDTRVSVTAQFLDYSETSFILKFQGANFRCSSEYGNAEIENVFGEETLKKLGTEVKISWVSDSCSSLVVYTGLYNSIVYGSFIRISSDIIEYYDRTKQLWLNNPELNVSVMKPDKMPEFKARISGTISTSICGIILLDGNLTNLLGNDLLDSLFSWKLYYENQLIFSDSIKGKSDIQIPVSNIFGNITASSTSNLQIIAELVVQNWIGMTSRKDEFKIDIQNNIYYDTSLSFDSPLNWDPVSEPLLIKPLIEVSNCIPNSLSTPLFNILSYSWKFPSDPELMKYVDLTDSSLLVPQGVVGNSYNKIEFAINLRVILKIENSIIVILNGDLAVMIDRAKFNKFFIRKSDSGQVLDNIFVSNDEKLQLDSGWQSRLEYESAIATKWSIDCKSLSDFIEIEGCMQAWNITRNSSVYISAATDTSLPSAVDIVVPSHYESFSFMVRLETLAAEMIFISSVKITVFSKKSLYPKIKVPEYMFLSKNINGLSLYTFLEKKDVLFEVEGQSNSSFSWQCSNYVFGREISFSSVSNVQIELKKDVFEAGIDYLCSVKETNFEKKLFGFASILFKLSEFSLHPSQLNVFPNIGSAYNTEFSWNVDFSLDDITCTYSYGIKKDANTDIFWIRRRSNLKQIKSYLPPGIWNFLVVIESENREVLSVLSTTMANVTFTKPKVLSYNKTDFDWFLIQSAVLTPVEIFRIASESTFIHSAHVSSLERIADILSNASFSLNLKDQLNCNIFFSLWSDVNQRSAVLFHESSNFDKKNLVQIYRKSFDLLELLYNKCSISDLHKSSLSFLVEGDRLFYKSKFNSEVQTIHGTFGYYSINRRAGGSFLNVHGKIDGNCEVWMDVVLPEISGNDDFRAVLAKEYTIPLALESGQMFTFESGSLFSLKIFHEDRYNGEISYSYNSDSYISPSFICGSLDKDSGVLNSTSCRKAVLNNSSFSCICTLKSGIFGMLQVYPLNSFDHAILNGSYLSVTESSFDLTNLLLLILFCFISLYSVFGVFVHISSAFKTIIISKRNASETLIIPLRECGFKMLVYLILLSGSISKVALIILEGNQSYSVSLRGIIVNYAIYCSFLVLQSLLFMLWNYEINLEILQTPLNQMALLRPILVILTGIVVMISSGLTLNWFIFGATEQLRSILSITALFYGGISAALVCIFLGMSVAILENVANQLKIMRKNGKRAAFQVTDVQYDSFDAAFKVVSAGVIFSIFLMVLISQQTLYVVVPKSMWPLSINSIVYPIFYCLEAILFLLMFKLTKFSSYWKLDEICLSFLQRLCFPTRQERRMLRV